LLLRPFPTVLIPPTPLLLIVERSSVNRKRQQVR
jgi:hypothetical protein